MHHGAKLEALERFAVEPGASLAEQDWSARCGFDRDRGAKTYDERSEATHRKHGKVDEAFPSVGVEAHSSRNQSMVVWRPSRNGVGLVPGKSS